MTQASCEIVAGLFLVASFLLAHTRRNSWIYFLKGVLIYIGELPSSYLHQDVEVPYFYKYVPRFSNTIVVIKSLICQLPGVCQQVLQMPSLQFTVFSLLAVCSAAEID
jgi:hypothetical protein